MTLRRPRCPTHVVSAAVKSTTTSDAPLANTRPGVGPICTRRKDWGPMSSVSLERASEAALTVLSGRWTLSVITALRQRPHSYNELSRTVGADHKTLDRALSHLRDSGLARREAHISSTGIPLHVQYSLTPPAHDLLPIIDALADWWRTHHE